jgi:hypothetical protein
MCDLLPHHVAPLILDIHHSLHNYQPPSAFLSGLRHNDWSPKRLEPATTT